MRLWQQVFWPTKLCDREWENKMNEKYKALTDDQLLLRIREEGDEESKTYLMEKYEELVHKRARSMYMLGGDAQDILQEGRIGLLKAIRDFDFGRDSSFFTFADLCISRQIFTAIQSSNRKKHEPLNRYVPLYGFGNGEEDADSGQINLMERLTKEAAIMDPESIVIDRENVKQIEQILENILSDFEKQVIDLMKTELNYVEIARVLSVPQKSIDNAIQRIRTKMRDALQKKS